MPQPQEPTVLIIGAGTFGTSTAYHLAKYYRDPSRITVIDRHPSPPDLAASTDINKIIRADYSSPFYCSLAYDALNSWATWTQLRPFYHRTGWIMLNEAGSDLASRIRRVFHERGDDPTEDVPISELEQRWKGVLRGTVTQGFDDAYWNPEAGWCDAAAATASLMKDTVRYGVRYVVGDVEEICLEAGKVKGVRTKAGDELVADKILLATGAWTSSLLSPVEDVLSIPDAERVEQQAQAAGVAVAHYKMTDEEMEELSEMPVVVYGDYGEVIPPPTNNRLLKYTNSNTFTNIITTPSGAKISVPPDQDQHIVPERLKREMESTMTSKVMPSFTRQKQPAYWRLCYDSYTPTQDWLLCRHPHAQLQNLFLAVGGSFHSYKFLPTVGMYMVNVLEGNSNGAEKDAAWKWKEAGLGAQRGAHEATKPGFDLQEVLREDAGDKAKL